MTGSRAAVIDRGEVRWLERARQGEQAAFAELVEAYQRPVYNLCYRMLGDPAEAEEAAQESFLKAYRGMRRYDPQRSFSTWLLSIASHHCIDQLRRRRLPVELAGGARAVGRSGGPRAGAGEIGDAARGT